MGRAERAESVLRALGVTDAPAFDSLVANLTVEGADAANGEVSRGKGGDARGERVERPQARPKWSTNRRHGLTQNDVNARREGPLRRPLPGTRDAPAGPPPLERFRKLVITDGVSN